MARQGERKGRPSGMPRGPLRRSVRIEGQEKQKEARIHIPADSEPPRRSQAIDQQEKASRPIKRKSRTQQQGPGRPRRQAKVRQVTSPQPSHTQVQSKEVAKKSQSKTGTSIKKAHAPRGRLRVEQQKAANEPKGLLPSERKDVEPRARRPQRLHATKVACVSSHLSSAALRQLQRETANDPLPRGIGEYKSALSNNSMPQSAPKDNENAKSEKAITVYSQTFIDELSERGILEQQFEKAGVQFDQPTNYKEIRAAILKERPDDVPSKKDYKTYVEALMNASNETAQRGIYGLFFGTPSVIGIPHIESPDERWLKHVPITGKVDRKDGEQMPHPDSAEGLQALHIPRWIRKRLQGHAVPCSRLAFPNFLVELKRDRSMYIGHVQNRHCGAVATQGFVEYFVQLSNDPDAWNTARVGSIEFNGDIVVGNVHWASKSKKNPQRRKYHMTRVMCRFVYGLNYREYKIARKEARNFREYFMKKRETFRRECKDLIRPPTEPLTSSSEEDEDSDTEAEEDVEEEDQEENDGIGGDGGEDNSDGDDSEPAGQKETLQPLIPAPRASSNKRSRGAGGRPAKRTKVGKRKDDMEDEPTELTQTSAEIGLA